MLDDEKVINFLNGSEPDSEGRYIIEIINFSTCEIEGYHDFIQWIFPTKQRSQFNYKAPVISDNFSSLFRTDYNAQKNFCITCQKFLNFIGYGCNLETKTIKEVPNCTMFYDRPSHNLLRITRILDSLNQIGLKKCSENLFLCLKETKELKAKKVSQCSFRYWENTQISENKLCEKK